jgi:glucose-6-phosphate isomerase
MLPRVNPTNTEAWKKLKEHYTEVSQLHIRDLFVEDPNRFTKFSLSATDILFDYSKNIITEKKIEILL